MNKRFRRTALHIACMRCNVEYLLLASEILNKNKTDKFGCTPFKVALLNNRKGQKQQQTILAMIQSGGVKLEGNGEDLRANGFEEEPLYISISLDDDTKRLFTISGDPPKVKVDKIDQ